MNLLWFYQPNLSSFITMPQISERFKNIPISSIRKLSPLVAPLKEQGIKIYHLNIGDPDVKTPEVMLEPLKNWQENPIRYAQVAGEPDFIKALLGYYHELGFDFLKNTNILATIGGSEAMVMTFLAVAEAGDEILVFEPFYSNYSVGATVSGVKLVPVATSINNGFHLPPVKNIEAQITPRTKAILFSNPCNPTGTVYTKEEIDTLVKVAREHNLFLISDEVYREYTFDNKTPISLLSFIAELPDRIIVLDSLSKRYSLCGARLGVLITLNESLMQGAIKIAQSRLSGGLIDQAIGAQLTKVPNSYIVEVRQEYQNRRDVLYNELIKIPGVTAYKPEGAFYVMVNLPVKDSDDFCLWLLSKFHPNNETVMLAPGNGFYATAGMGKNEVRIAYVLKEQDLKRSVEIIKEGLEIYNKMN
jgi:aspartate aminotransferase